MPDDVATLADATVQPTVPETAETTPSTPETPSTPTVQETADKDAIELGRILLQSGYNKDQVNDLIQAPQALSVVQNLIRTNPQEFLNMLERTDPDAAKNFHEKLADIYVERYADKGTPSGDHKQDASPDLMREVQALRSETQQLRTEQQRRDQAATLAQVENRYNARVDDLFGTKEVKELELTKSQQRAIRAELNAELAKDPNTVKRVSNGNFVDVPGKFKGIIESWASDKKTAAETAKAQRERVSNQGFPEFPAGPEPLMKDLPADAFDSWDKTEEALGAALARMR